MEEKSELNKGVGINLSIIIGVTNYDNVINLPGCNNDVKIIKDLLNLTNKYTESIVINEKTDSVSVKEKLSNFVDKHQGKVINEVFFYFTGHGSFDGEDFRYVLSDYNQDKVNQTTLSNIFLDSLLRNLNAKLTVKVVDACESGVQYIKSPEDINKYLNESKKGINNCYFMYSSQSNQSSYQAELSYFTKSFVSTVISYSGNEVSYINLIEGIKDTFIKNSRQTPYFVTQGSLTEKFCILNDTIRNLKIEGYEEIKSPSNQEVEDIELSVVDIIKKDSKQYCTKDELLEVILGIRDKVETYINESIVKDLYKFEYTFCNDYEEISNLSSVGTWLSKNGNNYFVEIIKERTNKQQKEDKSDNYITSLSTSFSALISSMQPQITGIRSSLDIPYKSIIINAVPQYPDIRNYNCSIIFLVSKIEIRLFYYFTFYKEISWDEIIIDDNFQWASESIKLKNKEEIYDTIGNIMSNFNKFIVNSIKKQFSIPTEDK